MSSYQDGEYETAIAAFTEARNRLKQIGDRHGEAEMLINLGVAHQRMGQLESAQRAFEKGLEIFTALGEPESQAIAFGNIGSLLMKQGDTERAIGYLERAVEIFGELNQPDRVAETCPLLARAYLRNRQWLDAITTYDRGMSCATDLTAAQRMLSGLIRILLQVMGVPR